MIVTIYRKRRCAIIAHYFIPPSPPAATTLSAQKPSPWSDSSWTGPRFIRTLKENLLWVRTFDTIEELRAALVEFATHYNETWLVARHGYRTPVQVRADQCRLDPNATANLKLAA